MSAIQTHEETPQIIRRPGGAMRPVAIPAPQAEGWSLKDFLSVLRKRKWLVMACLVLFTMAATGGTIKYFQQFLSRLKFTNLFSNTIFAPRFRHLATEGGLRNRAGADFATRQLSAVS